MDPSRTCRACGASISLADLEQRRAVIVMKRPYCGKCCDRIAANGMSGGRTNRRKLQFDTLALTGFRDHPRLVGAALFTVALGTLLVFLLARHSWY